MDLQADLRICLATHCMSVTKFWFCKLALTCVDLHFRWPRPKTYQVSFVTDREWYSYHFPELIKIVSDNYMYARTAQYIKSRKDLSEDKLEGLEEIVMDSAKAKAIFAASKSSMGKKSFNI